MKKYLFCLALSLSITVLVTAQKKVFIRIYSIGSIKSVEGFYSGHTDSSIIVTRKNQSDSINYSNIQFIKTKKTTGHHILIGAILGAAAGAITGLVTNKPAPPPDPNCSFCNVLDYAFYFTPGEAAAAGGLLGGASGVAVGAIIGLTNKRQTININGDFKNWRIISTQLDTWPVYLPK